MGSPRSSGTSESCLSELLQPSQQIPLHPIHASYRRPGKQVSLLPEPPIGQNLLRRLRISILDPNLGGMAENPLAFGLDVSAYIHDRIDLSDRIADKGNGTQSIGTAVR